MLSPGLYRQQKGCEYFFLLQGLYLGWPEGRLFFPVSLVSFWKKPGPSGPSDKFLRWHASIAKWLSLNYLRCYVHFRSELGCNETVTIVMCNIKLDEHLIIHWGFSCNQCVHALMPILLVLGPISTHLNVEWFIVQFPVIVFVHLRLI